MNPRDLGPGFSSQTLRSIVAVLCVALIVPGDSVAWARQQQATATPEQASKISNDQLDSLVAPIALYPDPLLAQVLVASTYPLEIIQLQQWLDRNKDLKDQALVEAVQKQNWDPSIQALAPLPSVVKLLSEIIAWTTDMGNVFLAQQTDVMGAVQRMRTKAQAKGKLKSTEHQKVETQVVEGNSFIVIEPTEPEVIYVPSYDPWDMYGDPFYPYYPMYYPPGYAGGMLLAFTAGLILGGWPHVAHWGSNNISINNNNNFVSHYNRQNVNRPGNLPASGGDSNWKHNPQHRGGAPYRDRATADRFGDTARGDSLANRQTGARQQIGRQGGNLPSNRAAGVGSADRSGGGSRNAFAGGPEGFNGSTARANSSRGASSMGSFGGGGFRGGGFRGGGRRR